MRFLLDTNVLSEAGKKRPNPKVLNWIMAKEPVSAVPSIAIAERYRGAHDAPPQKRERLLAELDALAQEAPHKILPFDNDAAKPNSEFFALPLPLLSCNFPAP